MNAFKQVSKAIRSYVTRKLDKPVLPPVSALPSNAIQYAGWYEPVSPREELTHFLERLAGISWIRIRDGRLILTQRGKWNDVFIPVADAQFRFVPKEDPPDPVPTLALLTPNDEGQFFQAGGTTMKHIPAWLAALEISLALFVLFSIVSILVYAPFWISGGLIKKRRRPAERGLRIWPLVSALSLVIPVGIFVLCEEFLLVSRMGRLTLWSGAVFLATVIFAAAAVASAVALWQVPAQAVRRGVRAIR